MMMVQGKGAPSARTEPVDKLQLNRMATRRQPVSSAATVAESLFNLSLQCIDTHVIAFNPHMSFWHYHWRWPVWRRDSVTCVRRHDGGQSALHCAMGYRKA